MDMYDSLYSPVCALNDQLARQIFDILPEDGPVLIIMDRQGNCWPSDHEKFDKLNISETFLNQLCSSIDDGNEPLITQADKYSLIATQLTTEKTNCGYAILALSDYSPETTMVNIDLIELILGQLSLIAKLIEKNNLLYELQLKHHNRNSNTHRSLN
jgi:hypothetical protein